ncbi:DUF202 domain-containing protein [Mastigocladus laminosus UU774]|nr:hypothetical protein B4U84_26170 [Westiellopsis prolifica IICB1]TFI54888.1 DUF202 domain-containing protein [Mastigocladus laminosus UU774]
MAWIHPSLSLISFWFSIDRTVAAVHKAIGDQINPLNLSRTLGLAFVIIGTWVLLSAVLSTRIFSESIKECASE